MYKKRSSLFTTIGWGLAFISVVLAQSWMLGWLPVFHLETWLERIARWLVVPQNPRLLWGLTFYILALILFLITWPQKASMPTWPHATTSLPFWNKKEIFLVFAFSLTLNVFGVSLRWLPQLVQAGLWVFGPLFLAWRLRRQEGARIPWLLETYDIWALGLLTLLAFVVGAWQLDLHPDRILGDENAFWYLIEYLRDLNSGKPSLFAPGVYTFPVLSSYIQAFVVSFSEPSLWGWRWSSVLVWILGLPPIYLIARVVWRHRHWAISASLIYLGIPYGLAFSRFGYNNMQTVPIIAWALLLALLGERYQSSFALALSGWIAGLGFFTYYGARGIFFVLLLWHFFRFNSQRKRRIWIFFIPWLLTILPLYTYCFVHRPGGCIDKLIESLPFRYMYLSGIFRGEISGILLFGPHDWKYLLPGPILLTRILLRGILLTWAAFHMLINLRWFQAAPLSGTWGAWLFFPGLMAWWKNRNHVSIQLLLGTWAFFFFVFSAGNTDPPSPHHLIGILPVLALLLTQGLQVITEILAYGVRKLGLQRESNTVIPVFVQLLALGVFVGGLYDYFVRVPQFYPPDLEGVINWCLLLARPNERVVYLAETQQDVGRRPVGMALSAIPLEKVLLSSWRLRVQKILPGTILVYLWYDDYPYPTEDKQVPPAWERWLIFQDQQGLIKVVLEAQDASRLIPRLLPWKTRLARSYPLAWWAWLFGWGIVMWHLYHLTLRIERRV